MHHRDLGPRATFDTVAERYDAARPRFPDELYDDVVARTGIAAGDTAVEVGPGTGIATRRMARLGLRITAIELGANLAAVARRNLAAFPGVKVVEASFEDWLPPAGPGVDLVYAATSWHWIDPATGYRKAHSLLRPGGHLAFWSATHIFPEGGDPFFRELQEVYEEIGCGLPAEAVWPAPDDLADASQEVLASGLFEDVSVSRFRWEIAYDADAYIALLETFSGHIAMEPWQRDRLYGEIRRRVALRPPGLVRRGWGAVLHVARRSDR